jgi:hypothetical protein
MTHAARLITVLLAGIAPAASALIAVKLPVSEIFTGSRVVVVGNVTKIDSEEGNVAASAKALKGDAPGDVIRFKFKNLPAVLANIKEGSPFVLLTGRKAENFALHIGDTWVLPQPTDKPQLFEVSHEKDLKQSYPGTTSALLKIVEATAADKYDMLDKVSDEASKAMLRGGTKDLFKVDAAGAVALIAVRSPDKYTEVYGRTKDGLRRLLSATPTGTSATSLPAPAVPVDTVAISPGDILTATGELTQLTGGGGSAKRRLWTDNTPASAAAFGNFGEDADKLYAVVVKDDNIYRYGLDGQSPPADFTRMTGERVTTYHKDNPKWLAGATAAALDVNGDGKMDVLINAPAGAMLLINRGYGAFFVDVDIDKALKDADGKPLIGVKSLWTAADVDADGLDDLIVVAPDTGAVTAVLNQKAVEKK